MTISFSGLASGLDTSSWITSLTNLKRAKVTTLETQREVFLDQQDVLANIKTFFNSFRTTLEKVTDTKLGIPQMDLFAQNLATSADLTKFTASATTDAQEGTYNIKVDKLATNTEAVSGYRYTTTKVETTTATESSKLKDIGMKSGNISVTVRGIEKGVYIDEKDTIADLTKKLKDIGVDSSYNADTGIFAVNVSITDIHDIGLTGIVDKLHLAGVNEGYRTGTDLQTKSVDTQWNNATEETKLSVLGVHAGHIYLDANDDSYDIEIQENDKVGDLIQALKDNDIDASIADGIFRMNGAVITGDTANFRTAFGLTDVVDENTQRSGTLDHQIITTNITNATTGTLLKDLGEGVTVNNGATVIVKNSNDKTSTITLQSTSTLGDLLAGLRNAGLSAQLNNDGFVEISGGTITGGTFDINSALGLQSVPYTAMVTGSALTETTEVFELVTYDTKLVEDLHVKKGYMKVTDEDGQINYLKIKTGETIQNLMADLAGLGISSVLGDDGVLTITGGAFESLTDAQVTDLCNRNVIVESDPSYKQATDLLYLLTGGDTFSAMQTTVASSSAKTMALRVQVTNTNLATTTTQLGTLGLGANENTVFTVRGENRTIAVTKTMTIKGLLDALQAQGISASFDEESAKISLDNATITSPSGAGSLSDVLKLDTTISGKYVQSNNLYTTETITADRTTQLKQLGIATSGNTTAVVHNSVGIATTTVTVSGTDTIGTLFDKLSAAGISANIENGVITLNSSEYKYIDGALATSLGIGTQNTAGYVESTTQTASGTVTWVHTENAGRNNTLAEVGKLTSGTDKLIVYNKYNTAVGTVTVSSTTTVGSMLDKLGELDCYGNITEGVVTLNSSNGNYVKGNMFGTSGNPGSVTLTYNATDPIDENTVLSNFGVSNGNLLIHKADGSYSTLSIDNTDSVGALFTKLASYGISTGISNGKVTLYGDGDLYVTTVQANGTSVSNASNVLTKLKLGNPTKTNATVKINTSSPVQDYIITKSALSDTKLSELTNSSGTSLGITGGQIYAYENGTRNTLNISVDDTISSLGTKLARYGITLGLTSDGTIYLDGNDNSYLSTDGLPSATASNLLTKIGISTSSWQTTYDSLSQTLQYTTDSDNVIDGNTKLTSLKDDSGHSLGITTGTYELYNNGVRSTETIGANTTVDDLFSILTANGMTANIGSDGSINIGANSKSYLATSAGAGASNLVDVLIDRWNFVNIYETNHLEKPENVTSAISRTTKLADIEPTGRYQEGFITVVKDGIQTDIYLAGDQTVGALMDELSLYGFETTVNGRGQLIVKNAGNSILQNYSGENASNALNILGITADKWITTNSYSSNDTVQVIKTNTFRTAVTEDTALSELGVTTGEYYIYKDGVRYTGLISSDETFGSLINTLSSFGLQASLVNKTGAGGQNYAQLTVLGSGNSYIATSKSATNASNVVSTLFPSDVETMYNYEAKLQTSTLVTTWTDATLDTKLSYFDKAGAAAQGTLSVNVDGVTNNILIGADETFGTLISKLDNLGVQATLNNGQFTIESGYVDFTINSTGTTSGLVNSIGLRYETDMGGYCASTAKVEQTVTIVEDMSESVVNYAGYDTDMSLLNISKGTLSIYRDGKKATVNIEEGQTFNKLRMDIANVFSDVELAFENGVMKIYSTTEGVKVNVGATNDTSNISAICGFLDTGEDYVTSARELYCVNGASKLTNAGLFKQGTITAGKFIIGDETFEIDENTTLNDIIAQINFSDKSNATAYWDSVDGKLVIKSKATGASLLNIEAVTSNFTDVMGFTTTEWNGDNSINTSKMNINSQEIGQNSSFSINGTQFTASSNTVTSDISRIKGVTINLKDVTEEGSIELKIEKDKESVATAVESIVDAYNELISNVEEELSSTGSLKGESGLKMIKNQIRSLMTSSLAGSSVFKNLSAIGISTQAASSGNISTSNISLLKFDKEKFISAFDSDLDSLKELLIGTDSKKGVLVQVEEVVESSIASVTGYFSTAENSIMKKIQNYNTKIDKANAAVESYKARLETKFSSMDLLISKMQNQYSSFLSA